VIISHIPKTARILMVGCGNSVLSEEMVADGYRSIINIDISARCCLLCHMFGTFSAAY